MKVLRSIRDTYSEILTNMNFHANPTRENYLNTIYDIYKIDANTKKNIFLFYKSELQVLKKTVDTIKNSKKRMTIHFFIAVISNTKCRSLFEEYLIRDQKDPDLKGIVHRLEDILDAEHALDVIESNGTSEEEVDFIESIPYEVEGRISSDEESSIEEDMNKKIELEQITKTLKIAKVNQRAYWIAGEIYIRDILNDENRYKDLIKNKGFDNFIIANISNNYNKSGKHKRGSYREDISARIPKELAALKVPLNQIIKNPQIFIHKNLLGKSKGKVLQYKIPEIAESILQLLD